MIPLKRIKHLDKQTCLCGNWVRERRGCGDQWGEIDWPVRGAGIIDYNLAGGVALYLTPYTNFNPR